MSLPSLSRIAWPDRIIAIEQTFRGEVQGEAYSERASFDANLRTKRLHGTFGAFRFSCNANLPAVKYQAVREIHPLFLRHNFHEVLLDFAGVGVLRQAEALAQSCYMRIDDNTRR